MLFEGQGNAEEQPEQTSNAIQKRYISFFGSPER